MKRFLSFLLSTYLLLSVHLSAQIIYQGAVNSHGFNAYQMVISPDNKFAYVITSGEVQVYQRNSFTGSLAFLSSVTQMPGGVSLYGASNIAMSADGRFVYSEGIFKAFIFKRDSVTGLLTPFQTLADGYFPSVTPCTNNNIVATRDNKNVYITGRNNLFIYKRDLVTDSLSLLDTLQNVNACAGLSFDVSLALSSDNKLAYITGGNSVSVYARDTSTGILTFKNIITGSSMANQPLAYARESVRSADDRYLYTATNYMGSGALVVLARNTSTDSLKIIQSLPNTIRPQYIYMSPDKRLLCISSGVATPTSALMFFAVDSLSGKLAYISTFQNSNRYDQTKCFDLTNRYIYSCPAFTDSVYIFRLSLFIDSAEYFCKGGNKTLQPWENYSSYLWSTGSTNPSIVVNAPGTYYLTATDHFGYSYTDSIVADTLALPVVNLGRDTALYPGESITLHGGLTNTQWQWNTNNDSLEYLYLKNDLTFYGTDTVIVKVTNAKGCSNSDTVIVRFLKTEITQSTLLYPNPAKDKINIDPGTSDEVNVELYDIRGRYVWGTSIRGKTSIDVSTLADGTYILSAHVAGAVIKKRLVLIR